MGLFMLKLKDVPFYNQTHLSRVPELVDRLIKDDNVHRITDICCHVRQTLPGVTSAAALSFLQNSSEYVEIDPGFWENIYVLHDLSVAAILENGKEFGIKTTRSMPEMGVTIDPELLIPFIPRYSGLSERFFACALAKAVSRHSSPDLIITNGVIVNFREAFIKDLYNVLLRERKALDPRDMALRLFDSKVGVYKKSLKSVSVKGAKSKVFHCALNPNEILKLTSIIEATIDEVVAARPEIFVRSEDGRINAHRNKTGIIKVKLTEEEQLVINTRDEADTATKVQIVLDANRPFLSKLIKQFRSRVDEEEIESRFYEKIWQSIIQYDDRWGHKFHTFLHRALKNILLDERTKREKKPLPMSLNTTINEKNNEELQNIIRDHRNAEDPVHHIHELDLLAKISELLDADAQKVVYGIMDGLKDREIAASMNRPMSDIVAIKRSLKRNRQFVKYLCS